MLLADEHAILREGVRALLRGTPDITVAGEAASGGVAVELAERVRPDVLVLELDLPDQDGLSVLHALAARGSSVRGLVLTRHPEQEGLLSALTAGARGYVAKTAPFAELVDAVRVVAGGEVYVRPSSSRLLAAAVAPHGSGRPAVLLFEDLSERERTVVLMVAQGYSGAEIARKLRISTKTVAAYKDRVREKLGLSHRTEYVRFAIQAGILGR